MSRPINEQTWHRLTGQGRYHGGTGQGRPQVRGCRIVRPTRLPDRTLVAALPGCRIVPPYPAEYLGRFCRLDRYGASCYPKRVGAWLSLVEHRVWDAGVVGSNPSAPTT